MTTESESIPSQSPQKAYSKLTRQEQRYYVASQWTLMRLRFAKHKLAILGLVIVITMYVAAFFYGFIAPYDAQRRFPNIYQPPTKIYWQNENGFTLQPFIYEIKSELDIKTFKYVVTEDRSTLHPIKIFVRGDEWNFYGLFRSNLHLFGTETKIPVYLLGTDDLGRDLFSRIIYGSAISLSVGLVGVLISFILGSILGGVSGYFVGIVDIIIQRAIEFLLSLPTIPIWMALSVAVPRTWPAVQVYFAITLILSLRGWCGLARVVRSKLLEIRHEDFVMAAQISGASDWRIITQHLLPATLSYLIVHMTLAIPGMILGETALSFLGLGLRPPVVSWGVLLQQSQNVGVVNTYPWLMMPAAFVVLIVLAFNFLGDGLRDAADPYRT